MHSLSLLAKHRRNCAPHQVSSRLSLPSLSKCRRASRCRLSPSATAPLAAASPQVSSCLSQACRHFGVNASNFVPYYYSIQSYKNTYCGRFEPLWEEEYWDPQPFHLVHNPMLRTRRGPGRHVTTRIQNEMDRPQTRARQ
ncbi:hypothetical protein Salat_1469500 [Sesamum alatum]|uniref:Uncharacterized protein n=1 Tax=Sesamum alatum TaxID=300844 RepID=A0AAE1YC08_9LAMI|nr:hypothetical protein Salat_1469500 [Sesamum alatum]